MLVLVVAVALCAAAGTASAQVGFTPPSYVDTELAGGEPLALTDTRNGTIVYSSHEGTTHLYRPGFTSLAPVLLQYRNQVNIWYSPDDGTSWNRVSVPGGFATPPAQNSGFSDPDLTQDEGGRIYNTGINLVNDALFSSGDGGKTWDKGTANCHNGDRPWLAGADPEHVYIATDTAEGSPSHTIFESTDGGNTCSQGGVPDGGKTAEGQDYGGYGKLYWDHARRELVEPALFYDDDGNVNGIGASTWRPGEARFTPVKVSATSLFSHFPTVSIDAGGNYYLVWDSDERTAAATPSPCSDPSAPKGKPLPNKVLMAVSTDGGKTWSAPVEVAAPPDARVLWPWGAAGDAGRFSIVWYQTDKVVDVDCEPASVFIYEARMTGAADPATRAITTVNASKRPIHQNGVCQGGTVCVASGKDRRLGDFFSNTVDQRGCEIIASGDTTQPDPNTGGPRAVSLPVILRQSSGPALVGNRDCSGVSGGDTGTPTCFDHTPPVSTLRQRGVRRSAARIRARGAATDRGCRAAAGLAAARGKVGQVLISLARTARHGCEFVNRKGRLTRRRSCRRAILMRARGSESWTFALRARLPRGNYRIDVRAVDISGNKETPNKRQNIVRFRVR